MRRWQVVTLWIVAFCVIPFAMAALGFSEQVIKWALYGGVFGALAHISKSQYWHYLKNKELNPFSKSFGHSSVPRPVDPERPPHPPRLNSPTKRLWFLIFLVGLVICGVTYGVFEIQHPRRDFSDILFNRPNNYWGYKIGMLMGAVLSFSGFLFAFLYDQLFGRLVSWVKKGGGPSLRQ